MLNISSTVGNLFSGLRAFAVAFIFFVPNAVLAQSTPTDLATLSLEELLNIDVSDQGKSTEYKRWSFGYSYRQLRVGNYKIGTRDVSLDDVLFTPGEMRTNENFPVVPTFIDQHVHAFSGSYRASTALSFSILVPYILQGTDHISSVPGFDEFRLSSDGIGDITLSASYQRELSDSAVLKTSLGIQIPTGSINEMGDTPRNGTGTLERLPYTMQLGSGTPDVAISAGYNQRVGQFSLGTNISSTIRTGMNENGYRLGNSYGVSLSAQYNLRWYLKPGMRISARHLGEIQGRDESLLVPMAFPFPASITNPANYGGEKIHAAFNVATCFSKNCNVTFTGEVGVPIYQNLNGVQPKDRYTIAFTTSIQF